MIVGLEGIHVCQGITLNDLLGAYPIWKLEDIPGLRALPEFNAQNDKATGRIGEVPRQGTRAGKTITFEGILKVNNIVQLAQAAEDLPSALSSTDELLWVSSPHASDPNAAGLPSRRFYARTIDAVVSTSWAENNRTVEKGFKTPFSVVIRMSDPRFYHTVESDTNSSVLIDPLAGTGAPVDPADSSVANGKGIELTVNNAGNYHTEGLITVENTGVGNIVNPVVSNETTGKFLRFRALTLAPNQGITIDSRRRRIVRFSGVNQRHKIDPTSTWWDRGQPFIAPGANTLRLRGWQVQAGSKLRAQFHSADIA